MTRERYLEMMEQLGKEPIESEIPPSWEDFPEDIISSINIQLNPINLFLLIPSR